MNGSQPVSRTRTVHGVPVPTFLYGTAWKEESTERLVAAALAAGFRGIDTANQRRHYHEAGVGNAVREALSAGGLSCDELFLQTKFTYREAQDHRLPFDPTADEATQVRQSVASSLEHLGVASLDSLLLHGPRGSPGLAESDIRVWRTMEELHREKRVRLIGVSNMTAGQLAELCDISEVRPAFVQNRCFARFGWDREVRALCRDQEVAYQGFSLLTANRTELVSREVAAIARAHGRSIPQVIFRFALQLAMICLTGTTSPARMREDLAVYDFELVDDEVRTLERLSG